MDLKRPARRPVYAKIVETIQELVRSGELAPGDQLLPERQLAEKLGVSRSSVRAALAILAGMGVIEISPRDGAYVRKREWADAVGPLAQVMFQERMNVYHLLEVRQIVETQAVRLAAQRADATDVERLRELSRRVAEDIRLRREADESDTKFHLGLVEAAKNPLLLEVMEALVIPMTELYGPTRRRMLSDPAVAPRFAEEHERIIDAIEAGDADAASRIVEQHIQRAVRHVDAELDATEP